MMSAMISRATAVEVGGVLMTWAREHGVPRAALVELFKRLTAVRGNASFRDSVAGLLFLVDDERDSSAEEKRE